MRSEYASDIVSVRSRRTWDKLIDVKSVDGDHFKRTNNES